MKIKLNETQQKKLTQALQKESAYREQFITARNLLAEAEKSRNDIFEMICDAHNVDLKKYDLQKTQLKDGEVILHELPADEKKSTVIKRTLNKKANEIKKTNAKGK